MTDAIEQSSLRLRPLPHAPTLSERTADDLRRAIAQGQIERGRLPAEPELARQMGVSRTTIRHAVSMLQDEGLVARRHGSGTYVVGEARLRHNLNLNFGLTDLIRSSGWRPGTRGMTVEEREGTRLECERLALDPRSRVIVIGRVRTADDRPVAKTVDFLSARLLDEIGLTVDRLGGNESLYRTLEESGLTIHHGVADITSAKADRRMSAELEIPVGAQLLLLDQVDFTATGQPVLLSHEYYVGNTLAVQVYRKGSGSSSL